MKKHLIVDGQIFQSIARHRGMGRYSEYLLNAIIKESEYQSVTILLSINGQSESLELEIKTIFKGTNLKYLNLYDSSSTTVDKIESYNKREINLYIDSLEIKREKLDFLLLAPFQEPIVSVFPHSVNKFLVFYDLIPYLYHEQYVYKMPFEKYLSHYKLLFEADCLLAISESVRSDIILYLGMPESKVVAIHGAAIRSERVSKSIKSFKLPKKFILMPTGDDPRKNNANGVKGFEIFNSRNKSDYKLVITSNIHYAEKAILEKLSNNIIFTGNIDEAELDWLYDKAVTVLFVSESEGLGLPVLEAVVSGSKVVCSSLDVFKEISKDAFYYCDQTDEDSIALALSSAVDAKFDNNQKDEYSRILKYYNWTQTAMRATSAMLSQEHVPQRKKRKIAVFTPKPDGISAIGKVVAETHPLLAEYFDVDYFFEEGSADVTTRPNYLQYIANYYPANSFSVQAYRDYDAVFYHIGNSDYHLRSIANSLYLPGFVIVHDTNVSDAYRVMVEKDIISQSRADLEVEISKAGEPTRGNHLTSIVTNQLGVITHSDYATDVIKEISGDIHVRKANLPTSSPTLPVDRDYKLLTFGLAGIIANIKGTEVIERLAGNSHYANHDFQLFGYNYLSDSTMKRLSSYSNVTIETNLSDYDFVRKIRKLDVFVNYRMQYQGETSLSTLEAMRQGVVVIVRNTGWYSELPDDVVVKVGSIQEIEEKINDLIKHPAKLKDISKRAVSYIYQQHSHLEYVLAMERLVSGIEEASFSDKRRLVKKIKNGSINTKDDFLREVSP